MLTVFLSEAGVIALIFPPLVNGRSQLLYIKELLSS